jgi:hypothetical protein
MMQSYVVRIWGTLPFMDKIHEDFNKEFNTNFKFPLQPKGEQKR